MTRLNVSKESNLILHDYRCKKGHIFDRLVPWNKYKVKCTCGAMADRVFLPRKQRATPFDPVVVFRKRDGTYIFPGRSSEHAPLGTERVELRTLAQVSKFEREENRRLKNIHQESQARRDAQYQAEKRVMREGVRAIFSSLSPRGRKFAEFAIAQSDARESMSSKASRFDPGFRISVFHDDASNRPAFRDVDTGWRGKRE